MRRGEERMEARAEREDAAGAARGARSLTVMRVVNGSGGAGVTCPGTIN